VKAGKITKVGAASYLKLVERTNLKQATTNAAELTMRVHDWDFNVDDQPEKKVREFKDESASLPATLRKPIWDMLDNKLAAAKKGNHMPKDYGADFAGQMLKNGKFGPMKKNDAGELTKQPTEEAYAAYYSTLEKLDAVRKKNPKITFEEERALLAKWTVGARLKAAHSSFSVQNYLTEPNANATDYSSAGH